MSKNISKLSGRIGLKDNLFQKLSERSLNSKNGDGLKEIAEKYHVGVSTIYTVQKVFMNFYDRNIEQKKLLFAMEAHACVRVHRMD